MTPYVSISQIMQGQQLPLCVPPLVPGVAVPFPFWSVALGGATVTDRLCTGAVYLTNQLCRREADCSCEPGLTDICVK